KPVSFDDQERCERQGTHESIQHAADEVVQIGPAPRPPGRLRADRFAAVQRPASCRTRRRSNRPTPEPNTPNTANQLNTMIVRPAPCGGVPSRSTPTADNSGRDEPPTRVHRAAYAESPSPSHRG